MGGSKEGKARVCLLTADNGIGVTVTFCSLPSGIWRFRASFHKPWGRSREACSVIDAVLVDVLLFHVVPAQAWACMCSFILERPKANHVSLLVVQSGLGSAAGDHPAEQREMQACSVSPFWIMAVGWMCVSLNLLTVLQQQVLQVFWALCTTRTQQTVL